MNNTLEDIFKKYRIDIKTNSMNRNPIDILEDLYLKISANDWNNIVKDISETESVEGHIFDEARNRFYRP